MKDGRLSGSLAIMFPIYLMIALSLPLLFLFLFSIALIFGIVPIVRAAPPGPVLVLPLYGEPLPARSPPLSV